MAGARLAVVGGVPQLADRAFRVRDGGDSSRHRLFVGHVELEQPAAVRFEISDRVEPTCRRVDRVPAGHEVFRSRASDARGATSDQDRFGAAGGVHAPDLLTARPALLELLAEQPEDAAYDLPLNRLALARLEELADLLGATANSLGGFLVLALWLRRRRLIGRQRSGLGDARCEDLA